MINQGNFQDTGSSQDSKNLDSPQPNTAASSAQKQILVSRQTHNFTQEIYTMSVTLSTIIRKILRCSWKKIKNYSAYPEYENQIKEKLIQTPNKIHSGKSRSLSSDFENRNHQYMARGNPLFTFKKSSQDNTEGLNHSHDISFNHHTPTSNTIIQALQTQFIANFSSQNEYHPNNPSQQQQIIPESGPIRRYSIDERTTTRALDKIPQLNSPPRNKFKVEFHYRSPIKNQDDYAMISQEYGIFQNKYKTAHEIRLLNNESETASFCDIHEEHGIAQTPNSKPFGIKSVSSQEIIIKEPLHSGKQKIKVVSQLPFKRKGKIALGQDKKKNKNKH